MIYSTSLASFISRGPWPLRPHSGRAIELSRNEVSLLWSRLVDHYKKITKNWKKHTIMSYGWSCLWRSMANVLLSAKTHNLDKNFDACSHEVRFYSHLPSLPCFTSTAIIKLKWTEKLQVIIFFKSLRCFKSLVLNVIVHVFFINAWIIVFDSKSSHPRNWRSCCSHLISELISKSGSYVLRNWKLVT